MVAGKHYIIVKIDKAAQRAKQDKVGSIYIPPKFLHMLYNLQYGEIIAIGTQTHAAFPEMEVGDQAIFHHSIEGNDTLLLDKETEKTEAGDVVASIEYRIVMVSKDKSHNLIYGVLKKDNIIVPFPDTVFLSHEIKGMEIEVKSDLISTVDASFWKSEEKMIQTIAIADERINQLKSGLKLNTTDIQRRVDAKNEIDYIQSEKLKISNYMNSMKFGIALLKYINPKTIYALGLDVAKRCIVRKDLLYPINLFGINFFIIKTPYILAQLPNEVSL